METALSELGECSTPELNTDWRSKIALRDRVFARPAHFLYAICGVELALSVTFAWLFGFRAQNPMAFLPQFYCFLLILCGPLCRRIDKPNLGGACETVGFLYGQGFALVALLYPMTAMARPFADVQLAAADHALGFDWLTFAQFVGERSALLAAFRAAYFSFAWQGAVILPLLFVTRKPSRAWTVILAANIALLITILVYPLFPAEGTFLHYGISPEKYPQMTARVAWVFGPAIHAIRDGGARLITRELMVPFISFPSYHAVAALLLAWAAWPVKWARWPFLLLNICMAASALIIGAHYLVDLIAGAAVAIGSIAVANCVFRNVGQTS